MHMISDPKVGDYLNGGRRYAVDHSTPAIKMPASNEKRPGWPPHQPSMWNQADEYGALPVKCYQDCIAILEDSVSVLQPAVESIYDDHYLELPYLLCQLDNDNIDTSRDDRALSLSNDSISRDRWYANTPFMGPPTGARGIRAHSEFLKFHDHEISSPSRDHCHGKFHKGAQIMAIQCGVAQDNLREAGVDTPWASKSIFINEGDLSKHVTPHHGGRVISAGDELLRVAAAKEAERKALDKQKKREEKEAEKEAITKRKKARENKRKEADEQRALLPPKRRGPSKKVKSDSQEAMQESLIDQSQALL
ncbi:hypothetical protein GcM1_193028 [Golovinomyces cichoracearum]|uniref:Uncharacterized protein n=1 Tax=Golovinomyces cichoracearum TaxID=62708 RepID=A0A420J0Z3_9PEZI|nr:hypothetical protein GcM1_193028 [Golovinomyces cichoracearum]